MIPVLQIVDSNFYGTTGRGGNRDSGTVFKISANGTLTTLYSFNPGHDGGNPYAGRVQGSDGSLYGTTGYGSTNGQGIVFRISTNGALTTLYSFSGGEDGAYPYAGLARGRDGNFYGMTWSGGDDDDGTVFKISRDGALTTLYSFSGTHDGASPNELVQGSDGNFYGTSFGGPYDQGTVFKISGDGAFSSLYSFTGGSDGGNPYGRLVQGRDGSFYGTTSSGGTNGGSGTVFRISTNGALTSLYSFSGANDGASPNELARGSDGNFYGTTSGGGTNGYGTVFKISSNGAFASLYSFTGGSNGANPYAGLVQGRDGDFYGTTAYGGGYTNQYGQSFGNVFNISPKGILTSLYSFTGAMMARTSLWGWCRTATAISMGRLLAAAWAEPGPFSG